MNQLAQDSVAQIGGLSLTTGLLVAIGVVIAGLLGAITVYLIRRENRWSRSPALSNADHIIAEAEEHANEIVAKATEEARLLRVEIEKERLKSLDSDKLEFGKLIDSYGSRLDRSLQDVTYSLEKEHMRVTEHFVDALQKIEQRVSNNAIEAKESMETFSRQSGALFETLSAEIENVEKGIQHLAVALEEAAANEADRNVLLVKEEMKKIGARTAESVLEVAKNLDRALQENLEKEFASISTDVEKYRQGRMQLVDERILVLIEQTAVIALNKELSMAEHSDLVYRALEEAKEQGVFV